jgi:hypothetical protein
MARIVKSGPEKTDLFAASHLVRYWHKADIPRLAAQDCCRANRPTHQIAVGRPLLARDLASLRQWSYYPGHVVA